MFDNKLKITRIWPAVIAAMPEIYFRFCFLAVHTRTTRLSIRTLHNSSMVRHTHSTFAKKNGTKFHVVWRQ